MHDVAVVHHVLLALQTQLAGLLGALLAAELDEVLVGGHLGSDEATLKVGMDDAGGLRCGSPDRDGPGTHFLHTGGKVGLQTEQLVAGG